jgi:alpha-1,2-mannosyltransferase
MSDSMTALRSRVTPGRRIASPRAAEAVLLRVAPWLLAISIGIHFVLVLTQAKMSMIDLRVYRDASPAWLHGDLYDWRLHTPNFDLPFTYPPFAALVFMPLSAGSWWLVRVAWQAASVVCLYWLVRLSLRLIARHRTERSMTPIADGVWRRRAMAMTALAVWLEPVRTTLNYGQVNLMLAAVVLASLVAVNRPMLTGLGIGVTTGIKLTPALSAVYLLATRRWAAAAWSLVAFGLTVAIAYVVSPAQSIRYWFTLLGDAGRIGPVGSAINQSLRGALSRTVGVDVGKGPLQIVLLLAIAASAVLLFFALRAAVRAGDTLASVVSVQFFTLLVSPISWSHHWVWMVPAVLWLVYGRPPAARRLVVATAVLWSLAGFSFVISFLLNAQVSIWMYSLPWYDAALGWAYPACGLLTLVTIALASRRPVPSPARSAGGSTERVEDAVDRASEVDVLAGDAAG